MVFCIFRFQILCNIDYLCLICLIIIVIVFEYHLYGGCLQLIRYTPKTNHVSRVYNVTIVLWLQYMVHVMLIPMLDVFCLYTIPFRIRAHCPIRLFSAVPSSRVFHVRWSGTFGMILDGFSRPYYYRNHMQCISIVRFLYFKIFQFRYLTHFSLLKLQCLLRHATFSYIHFMTPDLLLGIIVGYYYTWYEDCMRKNKNLCTTWIDYQKTFDSVPHTWMEKSIALVGVNSKIVRFCTLTN